MLLSVTRTRHLSILCARLATQPTHALVLTRKAIRASADNSLDQQLDLERTEQRKLIGGADNAEGIRAFFEKRAPKFTARS